MKSPTIKKTLRCTRCGTVDVFRGHLCQPGVRRTRTRFLSADLPRMGARLTSKDRKRIADTIGGFLR